VCYKAKKEEIYSMEEREDVVVENRRERDLKQREGLLKVLGRTEEKEGVGKINRREKAKSGREK
jgi:O-succinylbenzoate synthase